MRRFLVISFIAFAAAGALYRVLQEDRASWIAFGLAAGCAVLAFAAQLLHDNRRKHS